MRRIEAEDGTPLAAALRPGRAPTIVFLPGFRSDMTGGKALAVDAWAEAQGRAMLRLDYSGHGASGGRFEDGTIGRWRDDARRVIDAVAPEGKLLLIGSSMGGWIALLLAIGLGARVSGLVGIAAAPDFTERLIWNAMPTAQRETLLRDGVLRVPSEYGEDLAITRALIEDGRRHCLLGGAIPIACPVRLLQGQRDQDVPWQTALLLAERVDSEDVRIILLKDGDHRLSRPSDIALLTATLAALLGEDGA